MCGPFDLNSNIRAFQVQLGLDMDDIRHMTMHDVMKPADHGDEDRLSSAFAAPLSDPGNRLV